jgi:hypothetical protein
MILIERRLKPIQSLDLISAVGRRYDFLDAVVSCYMISRYVQTIGAFSRIKKIGFKCSLKSLIRFSVLIKIKSNSTEFTTATLRVKK